MRTHPAFRVVIVILALAASFGAEAPRSPRVLAIEQLADAGRYPEAEAAARAALTTDDAGERLAVTDLLVRSLYVGGKIKSQEAQQISLSVLEERTRRGDRGEDLARSLANRGVVLRETGDRAAARQHFDAALRELTDSAARIQKLRAQVLGERAWLDSLEGDFARGIAGYDEARAIFERFPGTERSMASAVNNQAILLKKLGRYTEAKERYLAALTLISKSGRIDSVVGTRTLVNLANLETDTAEYGAAREHFDAAIRSLEANPGSQVGFLAQTLVNLGALLQVMDQYDEAAVRYNRAAELIAQSDGPDSIPNALLVSNLGFLAMARGDLERAETLAREGLAIRERIRMDDSSVIGALQFLAEVLQKRGRTVEAMSLVQRAAKLAEAAFGHRHPKVAEALVVQGDLAVGAGDVAAGLRDILEAATIDEQIFGREHPATAEAWYRAARAEWLAGDASRCVTFAFDANASSRQCRLLFARSMSEEEALRRDAKKTDTLGLLLSLLQDDRMRGKVAVANAWDAVIRSRGLVEEEAAARRRWITDMPTLAADFSRSTEEVSRLLVLSPDDRKIQEHEKLLSAAREARQRSERAFAAVSRKYREREVSGAVGYGEVTTGLPAGTVLVAFVQWNELRREHGLQETGAHYGAFVQSGKAAPQWIPLGSADTIDRAVTRWKAAVVADRVVLTASDPAVKELHDAGTELRKLVWDPLRARVAKARLVLVVPDGPLNWVNLGALPAERGRYVVEDTAPIHYLAAERDLVRLHDAAPLNRGILLAGGIDFGSTPEHADTFNALPGSDREVREIAALWSHGAADAPDVRLLTGERATEDAVRTAAASVGVLHVATHGFMPSSAGQRSASRSLATSGLALASANTKSAAPERDGLLTNEEIATLDLARVGWVVLSGCSTGLGETRPLEGVLGLRRSFAIAGARTVIVSLWPVSDSDAAAWMKGLYAARLAGAATADATKQATLALIDASRAAKSVVHPASFAAFIATGDWR